MLRLNTESGQWLKYLLTLRCGHCNILTSWSEHFFCTLAKVKYPGRNVGKRICEEVKHSLEIEQNPNTHNPTWTKVFLTDKTCRSSLVTPTIHHPSHGMATSSKQTERV